MGLLRVEVGVTNPFQPAQQTSLELLVDTGALLSILPEERLRELGIEPRERRVFRLADGRQIEPEVGEARLHYDGYEGISKGVFGHKQDAAVMGVLALETLGLEVDPIKGELRPDTLFLYPANQIPTLSGHDFSRATNREPWRGFNH